VTLGLGIPLASHVKVIFSPSSVMLAALFALIVGATVNLNKNGFPLPGGGFQHNVGTM
jgi:hypothetical protein